MPAQSHFARSVWGIDPENFPSYFAELATSGHTAVEVGTPTDPAEADTLRQLAADHGLQVIAQIWTIGTTPDEHLASAHPQLEIALRLAPVLINSHTGKDHFPVSENATIIRGMQDHLSKLDPETLLVHETHRGRATFTAHLTSQLLSLVPEMQLCLDISHWTCVHESLLEDQSPAVDLAISRTRYLHARLGGTQTPQLHPPLDPAYQTERETFLTWWKRWIIQENAAQRPTYIATEYGPFPYAPPSTITNQEKALSEHNASTRKFVASIF